MVSHYYDVDTIVSLNTMNRILNIIEIISVIIILTVSLYSFDKNISDYLIMSKWFYTILIGLICLILLPIMRFLLLKHKVEFNNISTCFIPYLFMSVNLIVALYCILQLLKILPTTSSLFLATANFDNPAGISSSLSVTFPFFYYLKHRCKYSDTIILFVFLLNFAIFSILQTRTGILSIITIYFIMLLKERKILFNNKLFALLIVLIITVVLIYIMTHKTVSNRGRVLILSVCLQMFKEKPLFGFGLNGFQQNYMLYQAEYLKDLSEPYTMLADNVSHPLNEFVRLGVNFGVIGIVVLAVLYLLVIIYYLRNKNFISFIGLLVLLSLSINSIFSYPFKYPIATLALIYAIYIIFKKDIKRFLNNSLFLLSVSICSLIVFTIYYPWFNSQKEWGKILYEDTGSTVIEKYEELSHVLGNNPAFLYNYSFVLFNNNLYEKAYEKASYSMDKWANYDTALLLGDICLKNLDYGKAEEYYELASMMCPVKFVPLYGLFCLYLEQSDLEKMKVIGDEILTKKIKIRSSTIRQIKTDVKNIMIEYGLFK